MKRKFSIEFLHGQTKKTNKAKSLSPLQNNILQNKPQHLTKKVKW